MTRLERYYQERIEIENRYNEAKKAGDKEAMKKADIEFDNWVGRIQRKECEAFVELFQYYMIARKNGNSLINFDKCSTEDVLTLVGYLLRCGVKKFTYSAKSTAAIEVIREFTNQGCEIDGTTEVVTNRWLSGRIEKSPAIVFTL